MKKSVKNIIDAMELLKAAEVYDKYITPAGQGFLDGVTTIENVPEVVLKEKYDKLFEDYEKLKKINEENIDMIDKYKENSLSLEKNNIYFKNKYNDLLDRYNEIKRKRWF